MKKQLFTKDEIIGVTIAALFDVEDGLVIKTSADEFIYFAGYEETDRCGDHASYEVSFTDSIADLDKQEQRRIGFISDREYQKYIDDQEEKLRIKARNLAIQNELKRQEKEKKELEELERLKKKYEN